MIQLSDVTGGQQAVGRVHRPLDVADLVAIVRQAYRDGERLYPVSTGLNWGYGSSLPPQPGCSLVDLSGMRRIRNAEAVSVAHPVVVLEPGVTQRDLADFLRAHNPGLTFNVTGSSLETSILGNALDGGVGYRGPRRLDIFGLEVVTGTGEVLRTGFRRLGEASPLAHAHAYGLGPLPDGLFVQGNLGIVASACFRLELRPPVEAAVSVALHEEASFARFYDLLFRCKRLGLLPQVTHIGNRARTAGTLLPGTRQRLEEIHGLSPAQAAAEAQQALRLLAPATWTGLSGVGGTAAQLRAVVTEIRAQLRGVASLRVVRARHMDLAASAAQKLGAWGPARRAAAVIRAALPLQGLAAGQPTDAAVRALLDQFGETARSAQDLDASRAGLIYISPALPDDGAFVEDFLRRMSGRAREFGHELQITVNIETNNSAVAISNLVFDRHDAAAVARARDCAAALYALVLAEGLEVYRARTDMLPHLPERDPAYWEQMARLKAALDPAGILAPGRYVPFPP